MGRRNSQVWELIFEDSYFLWCYDQLDKNILDSLACTIILPFWKQNLVNSNYIVQNAGEEWDYGLIRENVYLYHDWEIFLPLGRWVFMQLRSQLWQLGKVSRQPEVQLLPVRLWHVHPLREPGGGGHHRGQGLGAQGEHLRQHHRQDLQIQREQDGARGGAGHQSEDPLCSLWAESPETPETSSVWSVSVPGPGAGGGEAWYEGHRHQHHRATVSQWPIGDIKWILTMIFGMLTEKMYNILISWPIFSSFCEYNIVTFHWFQITKDDFNSPPYSPPWHRSFSASIWV